MLNYKRYILLNALIIFTFLNTLTTKSQEVINRNVLNAYNNSQESELDNENDSLYKTGILYKKIRKQNLISISGLLGNSEHHKILLKSDSDVEYRGVNIGLIEKVTLKNLTPNYNLLKFNYYEFGVNLLSSESTIDYGEPGIEYEEPGNKFSSTNSLYHIELNLGIGRGYGWAIKSDQAFSLNNSTGITNGLILKNFDNSVNLSEEDTDPTGVSRDYFSSNMSYQVSKNFHLNLGISRFSTYEDFKLFEGISSKIIETGIFYAIDEYFIDYLANNKVEFIPIYNLIIQNSISYLIYNLKKDNDLFPFNGGKGILNFQYQVGITYKF